MILLKNVPFERMVKFLRDNICIQPPEFTPGALPADPAINYAAGIRTYHALLERLYSDTRCLEDHDDVKKYTELINTMVFLHTIFAFGALSGENDSSRISIDKTLLQHKYKKGNFTFRQQHLAHHGLILNYLSPEGECVSLRKASELVLAYPQHPDLVPAVKFLVERAESVDRQSNTLYNNFGVFIKGDIETALGHKSSNRSDLDPVRDDILRTVDSHQDAWIELVDKLHNHCELASSGFLHYHASPSWSVSWYEKGSKPLLIFTLGSNIVFVEFTLPLEAAENLILGRHSYSDSIREKLERFHCVSCPKKCKGANIIKIDGVSLCTGRAEARRIYTTLRTPEDFASIHTMLDKIYA